MDSIRKFILSRGNMKDIVVEAESFEVSELGVFFYKTGNGGKQLRIAYYPKANVISVVECPAENKSE